MSTHTHRMRSLWMGLAFAAVLFPAALTTPAIAHAATRTGGVPSPPGDLYEPPHPLPHAPPGTLIWAKRVKGLTLNPPAAIWQILYHSRSRTGHDIAVSGFAIVPTAPGRMATDPSTPGRMAPQDSATNAHRHTRSETTFRRSADSSSSVARYSSPPTTRASAPPVSRPDLSALAEAHAGARQHPRRRNPPRCRNSGKVVVAGHSQGGAAALMSAEQAPTYAPELDLVGVAARHPASSSRPWSTTSQPRPLGGST